MTTIEINQEATRQTRKVQFWAKVGNVIGCVIETIALLIVF